MLRNKCIYICCYILCSSNKWVKVYKIIDALSTFNKLISVVQSELRLAEHKPSFTKTSTMLPLLIAAIFAGTCTVGAGAALVGDTVPKKKDQQTEE